VFTSKWKPLFFVVFLSFPLLILLATFAFGQGAADGLLQVEVDGKHGFISLHGEMVIPANFEFAWGFSEGFAPAWKDGKAGYINDSSSFVPSFSMQDRL